jgi:excinuclease ABC subunit C
MSEVRLRAFDPKEFVSTLPKRPGVYRMLGAEGELLYVGKAKSLKDRVGSYFNPSRLDPKIQALVQQIADIEVTVTNSETEALLLEYNLIKAHRPRFNVPISICTIRTSIRGCLSIAAHVICPAVISDHSRAPMR